MEGSEENHVPKPYTAEEKLTPKQHHQQLGLGLGLVLQLGLDSGLDLGLQPSPSLDADPNLDQKVASEDVRTDKIVIDRELESLESIKLEREIMRLVMDTFSDEGIVEFPNPPEINEEFPNLVLEEKEKVIEIEGAESEAIEKGIDRELDVEEQDRDAKGDSDGGDSRNESEKDDRSGNGNVGGETGSVEDSKAGNFGRYQYPRRPDAEDCSHFMRTGMCKFRSSCKFNHPPRRKNQLYWVVINSWFYGVMFLILLKAAKEDAKEKEENPERPGQTECKYYSRSGGCKFGKACRYNHSIRKTPVAPIVEVNFLGLPIRPVVGCLSLVVSLYFGAVFHYPDRVKNSLQGEKECPFYMRNGSCKYGSNCRFNHPDPTAVGGGNAHSGYGNGGHVSQAASKSTVSPWSPPRALNETGTFAPPMFSPTQGIPSSNPEWNGYQWHGNDNVYPTIPDRRLPTPPAFARNSPAETNFYTHHIQQMPSDEYPERPGQPECSYFMKTGACKYKSGCKFDHPKNRITKIAPCALNDKGLPIRPDQNVCSNYTRYGICKFGPACKFSHPVNYGDSASSPVSAPVEPSSFGNSTAVADGWE
ncbi:zinc finger C-x8-C-x5-C-x3-H type family protein [Actinidia rufa]|uniref:Zinc finger C-x8-C-x5-C-x3-H type family protein n=1 Tax=Actinidia rufa TaxID=165716 RepID=A0A7J0GAV5_9ERIC|nr:zinc finger C-x8-C-x5-C-x3-H type family protein [Actinidia rufa]